MDMRVKDVQHGLIVFGAFQNGMLEEWEKCFGRWLRLANGEEIHAT